MATSGARAVGGRHLVRDLAQRAVGVAVGAQAGQQRVELAGRQVQAAQHRGRRGGEVAVVIQSLASRSSASRKVSSCFAKQNRTMPDSVRLAVERRHGDRGDLDVARQPFRKVRFRHRRNRIVSDALEVGAVGRQQGEAAALQAVAEQVALALVERRQVEVGRRVGHVAGDAMLHRRIHGEHVVLVDLAELGRQRRRRRHVADLPAGDVVGLAEARHDEGALGQFRMAAQRLVHARRRRPCARRPRRTGSGCRCRARCRPARRCRRAAAPSRSGCAAN